MMSAAGTQIIVSKINPTCVTVIIVISIGRQFIN